VHTASEFPAVTLEGLTECLPAASREQHDHGDQRDGQDPDQHPDHAVVSFPALELEPVVDVAAAGRSCMIVCSTVVLLNTVVPGTVAVSKTVVVLVDVVLVVVV
jgi:hypothetical protein